MNSEQRKGNYFSPELAQQNGKMIADAAAGFQPIGGTPLVLVCVRRPQGRAPSRRGPCLRSDNPSSSRSW